MSDIQVLIVDDSAVVRKVLKDILDSAAGIKVLDVAQDPIFAMSKIKLRKPDVIILDIEMPRMDGLTFLKKIMADDPIPVVMCSTLTTSGSKDATKALAYGAIEVIAKPKAALKNILEEELQAITDAVKAASKANLSKVLMRPVAPISSPKAVAPKNTPDVVVPSAGRSAHIEGSDQIIAIGTSTGGTLALETVLPSLPANTPGLVIVQHMPENFTASFAERLNALSLVEVKEAVDGERVRAGSALIAPGGRHMLVKRQGTQYYVEVKDGPTVSRHKPSVDVLFRSVSKCADTNALGIIMTGMGDDGAIGLKEMRDAKSRTLGQNKESCIVYGMPDMANKRGAVEREVGLVAIPGEITAWATQAQ